MKLDSNTLLHPEEIARAILVLRGRRVILDRELAAIYGVTTGRLNEAVKRNTGRFPTDFVFQLTIREYADLKSQSAISSWGGRRHGGRFRTSNTGPRAGKIHCHPQVAGDDLPIAKTTAGNAESIAA